MAVVVFLGVAFLATVALGFLPVFAEQAQNFVLFLCGLGAVACAPKLAILQNGFARKAHRPAYLANVRPFAIRLWGMGVMIVAIITALDSRS